MKQRKYTLPRHTNLARQGSRIGAFLIDLAIFIALTFAFFFGCFRLVLNPIAKPYKQEFVKEEINSHLCLPTESDTISTIIPVGTDFYGYRDAISYYYMNYLTGNVSEPGTGSRTANEPIKNEEGVEVPKSEYYTNEWINKNILGIRVEDPETDPDCLFTYVKVGDTYDKSQLGIPKDATKVTELEVLKYMESAYVYTYSKDFARLSYIIDLSNKYTFIYSLEFVLAGFIASIITYIVFPIIFRQGRTIGKKVFKLALATNDGYAFHNHQLPMRVMPLLVVLFSFLIPIWKDSFILFLIPLTIFLVSFALAMASPKRASLHDFTARTIVVDDASSIVFENELEEEEFIKKEDGFAEEDPDIIESGEEPGISYEK